MTMRASGSIGRAGRCLVGGLLGLTLGACGGDGVTSTCPAGQIGSPPNCRVPPSPCTRNTLIEEPVNVPSMWLIYDDFSVPDAGRLDVTLDWTAEESSVGFYLVPVGTCTLEEFNERTCEFIIRGEPSHQKPRVLRQPIEAGNYSWMIGNYNEDADESTALQIVLSTGSCPATGGRAPSASGRTTATPDLEGAGKH